MFHAEGYVDGQTYFKEGHIITLVMEYDERSCYMWLVSDKKLDTTTVERITAVLEVWAGRELLQALESGMTAVQREINRLGSSSLGINATVLGVSYKRHICIYGDQKGAYRGFQGACGLYLSPELVQIIGVSKNTGEKQKGMFIEREQTAHDLRQIMLRGFSQGRLQKGYFLLWEEESDV